MTKRHFKISTFARYGIVGAIGTLIDFSVLVILVELFEVSPIIANVPAFLLAVVNNYALNKSWTFKFKGTAHVKQFSKFLLVSCVGLLINILFMPVLLSIGFWYIVAKCIIILLVLIWNFTLNSIWTFK